MLRHSPCAGIAACAHSGPCGRLGVERTAKGPSGRTLALPAPADGRRFASARLLVGGHAVGLHQTDSGLVLELTGRDAWDPVNTVIALQRA